MELLPQAWPAAASPEGEAVTPAAAAARSRARQLHHASGVGHLYHWSIQRGGGGGGGGSVAEAPYDTSVTYGAGTGTGGAAGANGSAGSITLNWNVDNLSVTAPGTQSSVTGSAISNVAVTSGFDSTGGNTVTYSASGLPPGLSISAGGTISGTPTTPGTYTPTVTVTDSQALAVTSTSFTWTVTNTVSVTHPANQSSVSGTAITPLTNSATDSQTGQTFTWTATGLPTGLSIASSTGTITGTPTTPGTYTPTVRATDGAGFAGSTSFTWTVTNTVSVTNPGSQVERLGHGHHPLTNSATDSQTGQTFTWTATGLPTGLSIASSTGTITGTPTTPGTSTVTLTATDGLGFAGSTSFTWTVTNTVSVTNPGSQSSVSGTAITPHKLRH